MQEFVGIKTSVDESGFDADYPSDTVISIYDTFQMIAEQLIGHATLLMISYVDDGLRLAADTDIHLNTENAPLLTDVDPQDDILLITVKVAENKQLNPKGGE